MFPTPSLLPDHHVVSLVSQATETTHTHPTTSIGVSIQRGQGNSEAFCLWQLYIVIYSCAWEVNQQYHHVFFQVTKMEVYQWRFLVQGASVVGSIQSPSVGSTTLCTPYLLFWIQVCLSPWSNQNLSFITRVRYNIQTKMIAMWVAHRKSVRMRTTIERRIFWLESFCSSICEHRIELRVLSPKYHTHVLHVWNVYLHLVSI